VAAIAVQLASAQNQPPRSFVGTIAGIRVETADIEIKPDDGAVVVARITPDTLARKIAPGEKNLEKAQAIQITEVAPGDRVLATLEPGSANLRRLVVMPAGEIARRNESDRQEWQRRGVAGIVTRKRAGEITVTVRSFTGVSEARVIVGDDTSFKRYAPDSVRFSDAQPSRLSEVSVGDQLRARGRKSEDGLRVEAAEIVFGTFLVKAGTVVAVRPEANEFAVKELGTGKTIVVRLTPDSQLKRMPAMPPMMAGGSPGAPPGMGGSPPAAGGPPRTGMVPSGSSGGGPPQTGRAAFPGGPAGGMDLAQMVERMPAVKLEDLEPGEELVVSSTRGAANDRLTAIMVLGNAGALIRMASASGPGAMSQGPMGMGGMSVAGMGGGAADLSGLGLSGIMP